ncbi:MAG: hypothetical protein IT582_06190 [Opitutaceae bacterium]|nr:hypothetical protein [Opitutaceae bacterium]
MRYFKHFSSANVRDEARMYPRLNPQQVVKEDQLNDLPNPEGECRLLVVLLNPGSSPTCNVEHFPAWVESPIKRKNPTNRNVAKLVEDYAQTTSWEPTYYARIVCLFQTTGRDPIEAFDLPDALKFPSVEEIAHAHPDGAPVVLGWGSTFHPDANDYDANDVANFNAAKAQIIEQFTHAVGARYIHSIFGCVPVGPKGFGDIQGLQPAHPSARPTVRSKGWAAAVLEAISEL